MAVEWDGWCDLDDVEAMVSTRIWNSSQSNPEPDLDQVNNWIVEESVYASGRASANMAVPTTLSLTDHETFETNNPQAARLLKGITARLVGVRIIRYKFPRDDDRALMWQALMEEAEMRLASIEKGMTEVDAGSDETQIAGQSVPSKGKAPEVYTFNKRHW